MIDETLLDQLADYAAGLLDPEAAQRVERLLAADPGLAAVAAQLGAAQARVEASLAAAGDGAPGVPPEVAARLDAALAAELAAPANRLADPEPTDRDVSRGPDGPLPTGPAPRGPSSSRPGGARPGGRSRWRRGALAGGGVLAAVALVIGGFLGLRQSAVDQSATSSGAADSAKAPAFGGPTSLVIRHTNSDYTVDTLPTGPNGVGEAGAQGNAQDLEGLARLGDPAALGACLAEVVAAHPGTVEIVEYARFQGNPALIIVLVDAVGTRTVVAGPDCGLPGHGDDEVYVTPAR